MKNLRGLIGIVLALFFVSGVAQASVSGEYFGLSHGWPRLVDNGTMINNKKIKNYKGKTSYFEATNKYYGEGSKAPYFKEGPNVPRQYIRDASFNTWASIRNRGGTLEVLDGLFEVYGAMDFNGNSYGGLAFSASLIDVDWDEYTIAFKMQGDQQGFLCDIGFCSYTEELLTFNLYDGLFDGDFGKNFTFKGQTIATVPVPAAFWLFGTAFLGLVSIRRQALAQ